MPEGCIWRHAGLRFGDPSGCTKKDRRMKMFITGDSHGRVAYDAVRHRLEGNKDNLLDSVGFLIPLARMTTLTV